MMSRFLIPIRILKILLLTGLLLHRPSPAMAESAWVLSGGSSVSGSYQTAASASSSATNLSVNLGLGTTLLGGVEIMTVGTYLQQILGSLVNNSAWEINGQLNWMLSGSSSSSVYLAARGGYTLLKTTSTSNSSWIAGAGLGWRVPLASKITFDPNVFVLIFPGSLDTPPLIRFTVFQFTLVFGSSS